MGSAVRADLDPELPGSAFAACAGSTAFSLRFFRIPGVSEQLRQFSGADAVGKIRAHIVGSGKGRIRRLLLQNVEVDHDGLQHMLEGPHGIRIPEHQRAAALRSPDAVGDDAVRCEIAASDHIARSCRADGDPLLLQEGADIAVGHQLRAGL